MPFAVKLEMFGLRGCRFDLSREELIGKDQHRGEGGEVPSKGTNGNKKKTTSSVEIVEWIEGKARRKGNVDVPGRPKLSRNRLGK